MIECLTGTFLYYLTDSAVKKEGDRVILLRIHRRIAIRTGSITGSVGIAVRQLMISRDYPITLPKIIIGITMLAAGNTARHPWHPFGKER